MLILSGYKIYCINYPHVQSIIQRFPALMPKENPKGSELEQPAQSSNTLLNILVIILIVGVFYSIRCMKDQISQLQSELQTTKTKLSSEPIQVATNTVSNGKNSNCPKSEDDYNSCMDKVVRCKETEGEFASAEKEFERLIKDCAVSNEKNQAINADLQREVRELEENVRKLESN